MIYDTEFGRTNMMEYEPIVKTTCGVYVPIVEIVEMSAMQFRDMDGVFDTLQEPLVPPASAMFMRHEEGGIYIIDLADEFNQRVAGLDPKESRHYNESIVDATEHCIVNIWSKLHRKGRL